MTHRQPTTFKAASLLLLSAGVLSGCYTEQLLYVGGAVPTGTAVQYAASAFPHGPRAQFVNDSAVPLRVRYWVGRRDIFAPAGVTDIRTDDDLSFEAQPGDHFITQLGRKFWPSSMNDAVVRVRIDPVLESGEPQDPIWFQLEQPQPFVFSATGDNAESLVFNRFGGGAITALPRELWIDGNNGPFPVVRAAQPQAAAR